MRTKILTLGLACLLMLGSVLPVFGNFWDTAFRGIGYEKMFLRMDNGKMLEYTTYNKITINRTDFFTFLKNKDFTVSQIKVCIHNHPYSTEFSEGDKKFYRQIVEAGFKGKFLVYCKGRIAEYKGNS